MSPHRCPGAGGISLAHTGGGTRGLEGEQNPWRRGRCRELGLPIIPGAGFTPHGHHCLSTTPVSTCPLSQCPPVRYPSVPHCPGVCLSTLYSKLTGVSSHSSPTEEVQEATEPQVGPWCGGSAVPDTPEMGGGHPAAPPVPSPGCAVLGVILSPGGHRWGRKGCPGSRSHPVPHSPAPPARLWRGPRCHSPCCRVTSRRGSRTARPSQVPGMGGGCCGGLGGWSPPALLSSLLPPPTVAAPAKKGIPRPTPPCPCR